MSPAALHIPGKAQWISFLQGWLSPPMWGHTQGPERTRGGSHSNSVQPFKSSILPSSNLAASQREPGQPGPGFSKRGPEILRLPEAGFCLRGLNADLLQPTGTYSCLEGKILARTRLGARLVHTCSHHRHGGLAASSQKWVIQRPPEP